MADVILASKSPRRRELLAQIGVAFKAMSIDIDETQFDGETPEEYVSRLALGKASEVAQNITDTGHLAVLGADTCVVVDGNILGKPVDQSDAINMLQSLSGRTHNVYSGVALVSLLNEKHSVCVNQSQVTFRQLSMQDCLAYWQTGEPADKAGGYAVQGLGAMYISRIEGSYSGVMGLPLFETASMLTDFQIPTGIVVHE